MRIVYRLLISLVLPLLLTVRRLTGRDQASDLAQRLGAGQATGGKGSLVWLHAASNGELTSARPLIERMLARSPDLRLLVTTNTLTARDLAQGWGEPRLTAVLAPVDFDWAVRRFLRANRPAALVIIENELWPNRIAACHAAGVPVLVAGARLSEHTARGLARVPSLVRPMLGAITWLSAQDAASEQRYRDHGVDPLRIGPVVSLKAVARGRSSTVPSPLAWARPLTLLAASTHEGEEALVLDAFLAARDRVPGLRLILAPRHPRRSDEITRLVADRGEGCAVRSRGEVPGGDAIIYLADTMGEMDTWYAAAGMTFVGGSLVPRGGHTPFEPAAHSSLMLSGPHVANFTDAYAALWAQDAALRVTDAPSLADGIVTLSVELAHPPAPPARADRARKALAPFADHAGLDVILAALRAAVTGETTAPRGNA